MVYPLRRYQIFTLAANYGTRSKDGRWAVLYSSWSGSLTLCPSWWRYRILQLSDTCPSRFRSSATRAAPRSCWHDWRYMDWIWS